MEDILFHPFSFDFWPMDHFLFPAISLEKYSDQNQAKRSIQYQLFYALLRKQYIINLLKFNFALGDFMKKSQCFFLHQTIRHWVERWKEWMTGLTLVNHAIVTDSFLLDLPEYQKVLLSPVCNLSFLNDRNFYLPMSKTQNQYDSMILWLL